MSIGYMGYAKLADQFLLCNSTGLNRQVNALLSTAVWGAGWYNAAQHTNYADSQQHFEGAVNFELQGIPVIWNLIRDWLVEQRAHAQSVLLSPNGVTIHNYTKDAGDPRSGVWLGNAGFNIDNNALITVSCTCFALKRNETTNPGGYLANRVGPGQPVAPLNPVPKNRNPIPGWYAGATITWPGAPTWWTPANATGAVLQTANFTVNNNIQVIRGCTGDPNPVAVLMGVMHAEGTMNIWRDGGIADPYGDPAQPFTATGASIVMSLGGSFGFRLNHVLLTSDAYDVQGQNTPTTRNFGLAGMGDGDNPPFLMDLAAVGP